MAKKAAKYKAPREKLISPGHFALMIQRIALERMKAEALFINRIDRALHRRWGAKKYRRNSAIANLSLDDFLNDILK